MTPAIQEFMFAVSNSLAASILAKTTLVLTLGLFAAWLMRRSRASLRHAMLAAVFAVLLLLPIAAALAPPVRIALKPTAQSPVPAGRRSVAVFRGSAAARDFAAQPAPHPPAIPLSAILLTVWIAGAVLFLLPVAAGLWQVRHLRRSALPWRQGQSAASGLAIEAGVFRRVDVQLHDSLPGPMTCGALRPAILMPLDAETWTAEDLSRALVHELEHVRRCDWLVHCLARTICALYWFHPLVWMAWRRLELEAERSCDDAVLDRSEATAYADQLVGLARRLSATSKPPVLAMASPADLAKRVGSVLDSAQRRGRAGVLRITLAWAAAAMLVLAVSPLKIVAAQATTTQMQSSPLPQYSTSTQLIQVDVIVTDTRGGRTVTNLQKEDFTITEDGRPQAIAIFSFHSMEGSAPGYYLLGYYTANEASDGTYRKIRVALNPPVASMVTLDYRQGYWAAKFAVEPPDSNPSIPSDVRLPIPIYKPEPEYSEEARKARYQGAVRLFIEIDATGHVMPASTRVIRSLGLGLDETAAECVSRWRFKPATKGGNPIAVQAEVTVNFRLW